jgi:hypothetical protein
MNMLCASLACLLLAPAQLRTTPVAPSATILVVNHARNGRPVPGATVEVLTKSGGSFTAVFVGTTGADGAVTPDTSHGMWADLTNCTFRARIGVPGSTEVLVSEDSAKSSWHVPGEYPPKRTLVLPIDDFAAKLRGAGLMGRGGTYVYSLAANNYAEEGMTTAAVSYNVAPVVSRVVATQQTVPCSPVQVHQEWRPVTVYSPVTTCCQPPICPPIVWESPPVIWHYPCCPVIVP